MITVTNEYKNAVKDSFKQVVAYVTDGVDEITGDDDLRSFKIVANGGLCRTIMRQAEVGFWGSHDYLGKYLNIGLGVKLPEMEELGEITISIDEPAEIGMVAHGLKTGEQVKISTTGDLPTGLSESDSYYVVQIPLIGEDGFELDTFNLADSYENAMNGVLITTTGSQSGTHTLLKYTGEFSENIEELDYGAFKCVEIEEDKGTDQRKLKLFDRMYESLQSYEDLELEYPTTVLEVLQAICTRLGWTLATESFVHSDLEMASDLFVGIGLSYRDILEDIAEASGTIMYFNGDDELVLREISTDVLETLTTDDVVSLKLEPQWGELNSLVFSRTPQEDNIAVEDEESIAIYGRNEFRVENNLIVDSDRETYITDTFSVLNGIKYYPFEARTVGLGYFEIGDRIKVTDMDSAEYEVLVTDIEVNLSSGMKETVKGSIPDKTTTNYNTAGIIGKQIKRTEIIVDKQGGEIALLSQQISEGGILRQPTAPESPEIDDLWLNTADNRIYIWDGEEWLMTGFDPSILEDYYTKVETEAQIQIASDSITATVEQIEGHLDETQAGVDNNTSNILSLQTNVSTLEQRADSVDLTIEGIGGVNMFKNSVGLKGNIEEWQEFDEDGELIDEDNNGTVVQTSDIEENSESGSAIMIEGQYIKQTVPTIVGNPYVVYMRFKKLGGCSLIITGVIDPIEITAGEYVDETWAVFKYKFSAIDPVTTFTISNVGEEVGSYAMLTDIVCKVGDVNGWVQAPNEVYGKNFRFDKDGFTVTSLTDNFKAVLDNVKLGIYDTTSGSDKIMALFSKDRGLMTLLTAQDELVLQRYENNSGAVRFIPTSSGCMITVNSE